MPTDKLNIVNPDSEQLSEAYGITKARRVELSANMDRYVVAHIARAFAEKKILRIRISDEVNDFADFCDSPEELMYCVITHIMWMAARGRIVDGAKDNH